MGEIDSNNIKLPLFVDIGNTTIKAATRGMSKWEPLKPMGVANAADFAQWLQENSTTFSKVVVSSVRSDISAALQIELTGVPLKILTIADVERTKLNYQTPNTLGIDRYFGCLGASSHSAKPVVVIDNGSACTIDYMTANEIYMGGIIMPGLKSILNILSQVAPELPTIEPQIPTVWPGKDTITSLQWGQVGFFVDGVHAAIERYKSAFGDFDLYLTGGDAVLLAPLLKGAIRSRSNLVFEGMERLLNELD
ncbi:MAG: type III pantothenate kinase [Balneolaceae bacterium]